MARFLSKSEGLYGDAPGDIQIKDLTIEVTVEKRDAFITFVREYAETSIECLAERVPDEPLLRALITVFDGESSPERGRAFMRF